MQDAGRRTRLANERTYLAWWRTGLTSLAVAIGVGKIVPGISNNVTEWPYQVVGAAYGFLGIGFMIVAHMRVRAVERAVDAGTFARLDQRLGTGLLAVGIVIGAATVALVIFGRS
ncbi:MAG TPA: DUF202 domain-containing protein [Gaiellaceae bacterium]|nr:DUF202 domain-containing protein [Gaiellaceae bacterium]